MTDAREPRPGAARPRRRPDPYFLVGLVSVLVAGGVAVAVGRRPAGAATLPATLPEALDRRLAEGAAFPRLGAAAAPVRVVELLDYQCPACATAHRENWPALERAAREGTLTYEVRNVPLPSHGNAVAAAVFAGCVATVSPARFWAYHGALFERQAEWADRYPAEPALAEIAGAAGADTPGVRKCVERTGNQAAARLRGAFRAAADAGFTSVPVVSVNGNVVRWDQLQATMLGAKRPGAATGEER